MVPRHVAGPLAEVTYARALAGHSGRTGRGLVCKNRVVMPYAGKYTFIGLRLFADFGTALSVKIAVLTGVVVGRLKPTVKGTLPA